jgi:hypothetical protein
MPKSNCCGSPTTLAEGTTLYNICSDCDRPCDLIDDEIMSKKEILEVIKIRLPISEMGNRHFILPSNSDAREMSAIFTDDFIKLMKSIKAHLE